MEKEKQKIKKDGKGKIESAEERKDRLARSIGKLIGEAIREEPPEPQDEWA